MGQCSALDDAEESVDVLRESDGLRPLGAAWPWAGRGAERTETAPKESVSADVSRESGRLRPPGAAWPRAEAGAERTAAAPTGSVWLVPLACTWLWPREGTARPERGTGCEKP